GEQRAERDDELGAELLGKTDDEARERAPAQVRLDAEQENDVVFGSLRARVVEARLGPVDLPSHALDERDVRSRRLEVEEVLGLDLGKLLGAPGLGHVPGRERGTLRPRG